VQASSQSVQKTSEENIGGWQINTPSSYVKSVVGQFVLPKYNSTSYGRLQIFVGLGQPSGMVQYETIVSPNLGIYMASGGGGKTNYAAFFIFDSIHQYYESGAGYLMKPQDTIIANIWYSPSGLIHESLTDKTQGWSHVMQYQNSTISRNGAIWGVNEFFGPGEYPFGNFSTVRFSNDYANISGVSGYIGQFQNKYTILQITDHDAWGVGGAKVSGLSPYGSFTMTFYGQQVNP
jgi:Peptidase A4 family